MNLKNVPVFKKWSWYSKNQNFLRISNWFSTLENFRWFQNPGILKYVEEFQKMFFKTKKCSCTSKLVPKFQKMFTESKPRHEIKKNRILKNLHKFKKYSGIHKRFTYSKNVCGFLRKCSSFQNSSFQIQRKFTSSK